MNSQMEVIKAINEITKDKNTSYDTPATVLRVEDDTVWVHIDGGADETPVSKTISCEQGDTVQVRIANGSAFLVGNASAPPTDDAKAIIAQFVAEQADMNAVQAQNAATVAKATAEEAQTTATQAMAAVGNSLITYETWYLLSATQPTQPTEDSHSGWSTTEPAWVSGSTDNLYFSVRTVKGDGTITWSAVGMVQSYADLQILKNAIISTVASDYVAQGDSNVTSLSSTMIQNVNGVNIYNNTLAVGDSYAHIDGDSFDIKVCTTAGQIDDTNDGMYASFGREVTIGSRAQGSTVGTYSQVFGQDCTASGDYSHAEGRATEANGFYSYAEGWHTIASNSASHAEGNYTIASNIASHAEGSATKASGEASHAEGWGAEASGEASHAQNRSTIAKSDNQTAIGKYNISDSASTYALIIGNGTANNARSDALRVKWNGDVMDGSGNKISPTILTSSTISASTTSYTFSNSAIKTTSVLDLYDSIFGFSPTNMTVSNGSCTVTFPAQSGSHTMKLFIY
jgi:hypothetical protein